MIRLWFVALWVVIGFFILFAWFVQAAQATVSVAFPPGTVGVVVTLTGEENCFEPWAVMCVTSLTKQREYLIARPDDANFIHMTYLVLLFRPIDGPGFNFYLNQLQQGLKTRNKVIDEVVGSSEYKALHPK